MGEVKSSIPKTQEGIDKLLEDVASKIAKKEQDIDSEKGNESRNMESVIILKVALNHLKAAKDQLEKYKVI